jgi:hypothetical protein
MSAAHSLLQEVAAAGARLRIVGDRIKVKPAKLPGNLLDRLRQAKPELLALLSPPPHDDAGAWRAWHREMVAKWHGRGHPLADATRLAYGEAVNLIHSRRPVWLEAGTCAGCQQALVAPWLLTLPDGVAVHDQACLVAYGRQWRGEAAIALAAHGIARPENWTP